MVFKKQMLVAKAHNSGCQNQRFPFQSSKSQLRLGLQIFYFFPTGTNGLIAAGPCCIIAWSYTQDAERVALIWYKLSCTKTNYILKNTTVIVREWFFHHIVKCVWNAEVYVFVQFVQACQNRNSRGLFTDEKSFVPFTIK